MIFISILFVSLVLAAGCLSPVATLSPGSGAPLGTPAVSFVPGGGSALAIAFKTDEISTASPEAKELFLKGLTYSTQYARYNESLSFFDAALAIDRNFTGAWVARGVALHNMKRYDEAIKNYDMALAINPDDAGTWSVKAITLGDWGKSEEAAECNRRAAELDPRYGNDPRAAVTPSPAPSCENPLPPVPAGGDVYVGESCLDVSAGVSSGQVVSWYKNGRITGNDTPDEQRIVEDAKHFFVNPGDFVGHEGNWYAGTTGTIAFVVHVPVLDANTTATG
jgi:tetratricopeptide (TPR) repeat protein